MIEIAIFFRNVEMFPCLFAAFNASKTLDLLKRIFSFGSRPDGHLGRSENHCEVFGTVGV
jgi:hypothetical protein